MDKGILSSRIEYESAQLDGLEAIVSELVDTSDKSVARKAFVCAEALKRIGESLDQIALEIRSPGV